jgi:hypothetical protein
MIASLAPCATEAARSLFGRTPITTRAMSTGRRMVEPLAYTASTHSRPALPGSARAICFNGGARQHLDAARDELGVDERAEFWVDGRQHLRWLLHLDESGCRLGRAPSTAAARSGARAPGTKTLIFELPSRSSDSAM